MSQKETVKRVAEELIEAFKSGVLPERLALVFIKRNVEVPSKRWTWANRAVGLARGHVYAAGFRQWEALGRKVRKGEKCFHILGPRLVKVEDDQKENEDAKTLVGYYAIPVFGYLQTDGPPLPGAEDEPAFVDALPLIDVARSWHIKVGTHSVKDDPTALGFYADRMICLASENLLVWAHELIHAADHRLGNHTAPGFLAEVVAQLGGSVLLRCLGKEEHSDPGFVFSYIEEYCTKYKQNLIGACTQVLERTCEAVSLLLEEGERLALKTA